MDKLIRFLKKILNELKDGVFSLSVRPKYKMELLPIPVRFLFAEYDLSKGEFSRPRPHCDQIRHQRSTLIYQDQLH